MSRSRFQVMINENHVGRDETPANKYHVDQCWVVRDLAQQGMFPEEWCAHIGITMGTLYNWANMHPEFDEAVNIAWWILRAYWTRKARENIVGEGMNPVILKRILEKRFPDTYGQNATNTHETFMNRNLTGEAVGEQGIKTLDDDEIAERIKLFEDRRKQEENP